MTTSTPSNRTEGQETKFKRLVEDSAKHGTTLALDKIDTDSEGWQRMLEHGDDFKTAHAEFIVTKTRELTIVRFADEKKESSYQYPDGYVQHELEAQIETLKGLGIKLKKLGVVEKLPDGAEHCFVIPAPTDIAPDKTEHPYNYALDWALERIGKSRTFYNYRKGRTGHQYLRWAERSQRMFGQLAKMQDNCTLVVPGQFGLLHRGESVRLARELFYKYEFGAGPYEVAMMLLTHPERLVQWEQLHCDCPGGEYSPDADGVFGSAPYLDFGGDKVNFSTNSVDRPFVRYGSVSFFLPQ